jgi:hypothetical protein
MAHKPAPEDNGFSNYDGPIRPNIQKLKPNMEAYRAALIRAQKAKEEEEEDSAK